MWVYFSFHSFEKQQVGFKNFAKTIELMKISRIPHKSHFQSGKYDPLPLWSWINARLPKKNSSLRHFIISKQTKMLSLPPHLSQTISQTCIIINLIILKVKESERKRDNLASRRLWWRIMVELKEMSVDLECRSIGLVKQLYHAKWMHFGDGERSIPFIF